MKKSIHERFSGIYTLVEIVDNFCDTEWYRNEDEAFKAFCEDYAEEIKEFDGAETYASAVLNDWFQSTK